MYPVIENIKKDFLAVADEKTRRSGERFFREEVKLYGVKSAAVEEIGKKYFPAVKPGGKERVFSICEELFASGYLEDSFIACNWAYKMHSDYKPADIDTFEKWIDNYVSNWATCDTLCNHTVGTFIEMYPQFISELKRWALSENRWKKRAAAVSLIVPAKKGFFLKDVFEIADIMLTGKDDMVQKGYGWMLKVAANKHEQEVFDYVVRNRKVMPRTALRYAIEKMPAELKKEAMKRE